MSVGKLFHVFAQATRKADTYVYITERLIHMYTLQKG